MDKKHILLYGDSNTWGYNAENCARFSDDERWTLKLAKMLGDDYLVIEEGLNGRTTCFDDPITDGLNGLKYFDISLRTHNPIDTVVIMLGTNDCKQRFNATPENITQGIENLIIKARNFENLSGKTRIIIVAPIIIGTKIYSTDVAGSMGEMCAEKSQKLPKLYKALASQYDCEFLDSNEFVTPTDVDYMHLDLESQQSFAQGLFKLIAKN